MKQLIQQALLQLLQTTPLSTVTVKDITRAANIHRATFYVYFSSKQELYKTIIEDTLYDLERAIRPDPQLTLTAIEQLYAHEQGILDEALRFTTHIQQNKAVYSALLKEQHFQESFIEVIYQCMTLGKILPNIYTQHLAYGAVGLVREWLDHNEQSAEDIAGYLTQMSLHALLHYPASHKSAAP